MLTYWLINAFTHSVTCFIITLILFMSIVSNDGLDKGLYVMGVFTYTGIVNVCTGKVFLMTRTHNYISTLCLALSIIAWFLWLTCYSFIIIEPSQLTVWKLGYAVLDLPSWWLCSLLIPVVALSRDFVWRAYKDCYRPTPIMEAIHTEHKYPGGLEAVINARKETESKKAAERTASLQKSHRRSAIDILRENGSGIGYAYTGTEAADPNHGSDWEQRLKKVYFLYEVKMKAWKKPKKAEDGEDGAKSQK
jgi:hypothetical protein